jgi:formyltetrahydrofolate deformylase
MKLGLSAHAGRGPARLSCVLGPASATLNVVCAASDDSTGQILEAVYAADCRVAESAQHFDRDTGLLFPRVVADTSVSGSTGEYLAARLRDLAARSGMAMELRRAERRARVAIFVSKYDHCLYDLLLRQRAGELDCDIPVVVSNHPDLAGVAREFGVDYEVVPKTAQNKRDAELRECALLLDRGTDLIVMARYMQVLSNDFVERWPERVINIHHSFLPAFVGAKPYHQAIDRGVKLIGATAHYATANLDEGPIIEQDVVRCTHKDSVEDLVRKGRDLEKQVLARAVRWHLESRVAVYGNKTVVFA